MSFAFVVNILRQNKSTHEDMMQKSHYLFPIFVNRFLKLRQELCDLFFLRNCTQFPISEPFEYFTLLKERYTADNVHVALDLLSSCKIKLQTGVAYYMHQT